MSTEQRDDGGPAFPNDYSATIDLNCGMTLRDYAAIKFAAAMLANPAHAEYLHEHDVRTKIALASADAFIKARTL